LRLLNEAKLDWINTDGKNNWYCTGSFFGGEYRRSVDRGDHSNITSNQIGSQARQLVVISVRPSVFNEYIPTLFVASSGKALSKGCHKMGGCTRGCGIKISDHRDRRLLCAGDVWPSGHHAAEQAKKLAPSHLPACP
jgi:hypothetical protein